MPLFFSNEFERSQMKNLKIHHLQDLHSLVRIRNKYFRIMFQEAFKMGHYFRGFADGLASAEEGEINRRKIRLPTNTCTQKGSGFPLSPSIPRSSADFDPRKTIIDATFERGRRPRDDACFTCDTVRYVK